MWGLGLRPPTVKEVRFSLWVLANVFLGFLGSLGEGINLVCNLGD